MVLNLKNHDHLFLKYKQISIFHQFRPTLRSLEWGDEEELDETDEEEEFDLNDEEIGSELEDLATEPMVKEASKFKMSREIKKAVRPSWECKLASDH